MISWRRVVRRIEQDWGDEERQCQFRWDGERRRAWSEGEQCPAKGQEDRVGSADATRRRGQGDGRNEKNQKLFEFPHLKVAAAWWGAPNL